MSDSKMYCQRCENILVCFKLLSVTPDEASSIKADRAKAQDFVPYFYGYICLDCAKDGGQLAGILDILRSLSPESFSGF